MTLARRASQWLRIVADRRGVTVSALRRDLRTAPALATEMARLIDAMSRDEAAHLLADKKPLPSDADWLLRLHFERQRAARDEQERKEQEAAWATYYAAQQGAK